MMVPLRGGMSLRSAVALSRESSYRRRNLSCSRLTSSLTFFTSAALNEFTAFLIAGRKKRGLKVENTLNISSAV